MKTQIGKIKSIPLEEREIVAGIQVETLHGVGIVISGLKSLENKFAVGLGKNRGVEDFFLSEIRTIVVEYFNPDNHNFDPAEVEQFPLNLSQWQQAIDDKLIDSDKEIEFEIKDNGVVLDRNWSYYQARIISSSGKKYTQRELEIAYCIGLLNRMLTVDELAKELETAKEKIKLLMLAFERGDFNPR